MDIGRSADADSTLSQQIFDISMTQAKAIIEPYSILNDFPTLCIGVATPNYTSILDFLFLASEAVEWNIQSDILEPRDDYCNFDEDGRADHLPIIGIMSPPE